MDGDDEGQEAANDNARPVNNADGGAEEPGRAAGGGDEVFA
jgi:hypothetical protein